MSTIDEATVTKVAKLARIRITDDERKVYAQELSNIFNWIEQLQQVNTDGVEQMVSVAPVTLPMRDDVVTDGNRRDEVLANAPVAEYGCFAVPKVIE